MVKDSKLSSILNTYYNEEATKTLESETDYSTEQIINLGEKNEIMNKEKEELILKVLNKNTDSLISTLSFLKELKKDLHYGLENVRDVKSALLEIKEKYSEIDKALYNEKAEFENLCNETFKLEKIRNIMKLNLNIKKKKNVSFDQFKTIYESFRKINEFFVMLQNNNNNMEEEREKEKERIIKALEIYKENELLIREMFDQKFKEEKFKNEKKTEFLLKAAIFLYGEMEAMNLLSTKIFNLVQKYLDVVDNESSKIILTSKKKIEINENKKTILNNNNNIHSKEETKCSIKIEEISSLVSKKIILNFFSPFEIFLSLFPYNGKTNESFHSIDNLNPLNAKREENEKKKFLKDFIEKIIKRIKETFQRIIKSLGTFFFSFEEEILLEIFLDISSSLSKKLINENSIANKYFGLLLQFSIECCVEFIFNDFSEFIESLNKELEVNKNLNKNIDIQVNIQIDNENLNKEKENNILEKIEDLKENILAQTCSKFVKISKIVKVCKNHFNIEGLGEIIFLKLENETQKLIEEKFIDLERIQNFLNKKIDSLKNEFESDKNNEIIINKEICKNIMEEIKTISVSQNNNNNKIILYRKILITIKIFDKIISSLIKSFENLFPMVLENKKSLNFFNDGIFRICENLEIRLKNYKFTEIFLISLLLFNEYKKEFYVFDWIYFYIFDKKFLKQNNLLERTEIECFDSVNKEKLEKIRFENGILKILDFGNEKEKMYFEAIRLFFFMVDLNDEILTEEEKSYISKFVPLDVIENF